MTIFTERRTAGNVVSSNANGGTVPWTNPNNARALDGVYATAQGTGLSHRLNATNFGYTLPNAAQIRGIRTIIYRHGGEPRSPWVRTTAGQYTFKVPVGVTTIQFDIRGAEGGSDPRHGSRIDLTQQDVWSRRYPGRGGRVTGSLSVTPGETLTIMVGGRGNGIQGGFNGGGQGGYESGPTDGTNSRNGTGGGGATDIRSAGSGINNRRVIAAGGGGAPAWYTDAQAIAGGDGGQTTGANWYRWLSTSGIWSWVHQTARPTGGTPSAGGLGGDIGWSAANGGNGSLGVGGRGASTRDAVAGGSTLGAGGGGGGGGYYGGGGGHAIAHWPGASGPGAGGSNFAGVGTSGIVHFRGYQVGDGQVTLTFNPSPHVLDNRISLIKNGALIVQNQGAGVPWGTVPGAFETRGGPTWLWDTTWSPAEIRANDFGVSLAADFVDNPQAFVDAIDLEVTYNLDLTMTVLFPQHNGIIDSPAFTPEWRTTVDTIDRFQREYRVRIYRANQTTVLYDSGVVNSEVQSHPIPTTWGAENNTDYFLRITAVDIEGVEGDTGFRPFTTAWTPPPTITGVTVQPVGGE